MGPSQNVAESSNEEARRQEYWHAIAAQKSSSNVRSSAMIDSKWVHQVEVPTVLNHLRLHDPISIVFDPTDATFAVLNSSLIYDNDYTKIPLPSYHYSSIFDVITIFEVMGVHSRMSGTKIKEKSQEREVSVNRSPEVGMPIHRYVVKKKRRPYKHGIKSARLPIVTFPLIDLGYVVFLKRIFLSIQTLHVLTPGLGSLQQSAEVEHLAVKGTAKKKAQVPGEEKGKSQAAAKDAVETKKSLHDFAATGNNDALRAALQESSAQVDQLDLYDRTALYWAAAEGHDDTVRVLLKSGANPNIQSSNTRRTPLWWAAGNGHAEIVSLLLERGAKPNILDIHLQSPLHWAVRKGHNAVVEQLIKSKADIDSRDSHGRTPLSWAAEYSKDDVIQLNSIREPEQDDIIGMLIDHGANINTTDDQGRTPLHWAAKNGHKAVIKRLLKGGADTHWKDKSGRTPLSWVAEYANDDFLQLNSIGEPEQDDIIGMLIDHGAKIGTTDDEGRTPLHWAAKNGHKAVVEHLLKSGAYNLWEDKSGRTPKLQAAADGHEAIVELLSRTDF